MSEEAKVKRRRKVEAPEAVEPSGVAPTFPMLTQWELSQLRIFDLESRLACAEAETSRLRKKFYLSLLDPKGTVAKEELRYEKHMAAVKEHGTKYQTLIARISMRLNVDLSKCAFDTETGMVHLPDSAMGGK